MADVAASKRAAGSQQQQQQHHGVFPSDTAGCWVASVMKPGMSRSL